MRLILRFILAGLLATTAASGCGPSLSEEELGTVLFEVPEVPGSEEPYTLPDAVPAPLSESEPDPSDVES